MITDVYAEGRLRGCPFCGNTPEFMASANLSSIFITVRCKGCGIKRERRLDNPSRVGQLDAEISSIMILWNSRTEDSK